MTHRTPRYDPDRDGLIDAVSQSAVDPPTEYVSTESELVDALENSPAGGQVNIELTDNITTDFGVRGFVVPADRVDLNLAGYVVKRADGAENRIFDLDMGNAGYIAIRNGTVNGNRANQPNFPDAAGKKHEVMVRKANKFVARNLTVKNNTNFSIHSRSCLKTVYMGCEVQTSWGDLAGDGSVNGVEDAAGLDGYHVNNSDGRALKSVHIFDCVAESGDDGVGIIDVGSLGEVHVSGNFRSDATGGGVKVLDSADGSVIERVTVDAGARASPSGNDRALSLRMDGASGATFDSVGVWGTYRTDSGLPAAFLSTGGDIADLQMQGTFEGMDIEAGGSTYSGRISGVIHQPNGGTRGIHLKNVAGELTLDCTGHSDDNSSAMYYASDSSEIVFSGTNHSFYRDVSTGGTSDNNVVEMVNRGGGDASLAGASSVVVHE